jgi:hypothetical protein
MININFDANIYDGTYFTTSDVEPYVGGDTLYLYNGKGKSRGWGKPEVTSTVVLQSTDLIVTHTRFRHKHGGGQFWRYYNITSNNDLVQTKWVSLDDDTRQVILEAYTALPNWINPPGKLRKDYKSANPKKNMFIAYKIMGVNDVDKLHSLYNPEVIYTLGKTKVQAARGGYNWGEYIHNGGYYVHLSADECTQRYLNGTLVSEDKIVNRAMLVKCECWGNQVYFPNGKIAVTYCKPIEVVKEITLGK